MGEPDPSAAMRLLALIRSDLHRYAGESSWRAFRAAYRYQPGFRFLVWFRVVQRLRGGGRGKRGVLHQWLFRRVYNRMRAIGYRFGFDIPVSVEFGPGMKLGHFGGVVMQARVRLGANCLVGHGVTLGMVPRGKRMGSPTLGNAVYVGPGAVVVGGIMIGDEVLIAPNAFVNFDVPARSVVVGNPGQIVSEEGVEGYIRNRWGK